MGYELKRSVFLSELTNKLKLDFLGKDLKIRNVASFNNAGEFSLTFTKVLNDSCKNMSIICPLDITSNTVYNSNALISSKNPRLDFIRSLDYLVNEVGFSTYDFESIIHPSVKLGMNVVVENGCSIGENVVIEHNVVIHTGTTIGKNSRIRANSSIGGDGFGFERLVDGAPLRFPHLGGVVIGKNVEIGSNTCIARGTLSDTIIEDNVKIDNLVHIAHNCVIKKSAFVIACAEISGGAVVGEYSWVGPNACVIQKVIIGDNALVGIGSVVINDIESESICVGNPSKYLRKNIVSYS